MPKRGDELIDGLDEDGDGVMPVGSSKPTVAGPRSPSDSSAPTRAAAPLIDELKKLTKDAFDLDSVINAARHRIDGPDDIYQFSGDIREAVNRYK